MTNDPRRFSLPAEFDPDLVMRELAEPPVRVETPGSPDVGAEELQRLFDQTSRQPFGGYRPELISEEIASFHQSPGGVAEDNAFPLYLASYILGKINNDRFIHGPPDGDASLIDDETNKLPGWSIVDNTTNGGTVTWDDEGLGVGSLQFRVTDGQVGDTLYIEQDLFTAGGNYDILSLAADWVGIADAAGGYEGAYDTFIEYGWFYPDGTLNGSYTQKTFDNSTNERLDRLWLVTNSRSNAFLRVRIGVKITTAWSTDDEYYLAQLRFTWIEDPESYDVTLPFMRQSWSPSGTGLDLRMFCHSNAYGMSNWTAVGPGMLLSIGVYTDDTITAGEIRFFPRVGGTPKSADEYSAILGSGETKAVRFRDPSDATSFDFNALQLIDVKANASTSPAFASTGSADYVGSLQIRIIVAYDEDAPGGGGGPFGPAST